MTSNKQIYLNNNITELTEITVNSIETKNYPIKYINKYTKNQKKNLLIEPNMICYWNTMLTYKDSQDS